MLEYITGDIHVIKDDYIVIENGGIGYRVYTSTNSIRDFKLYEAFTVYLKMIVREDQILLYGFSEEQELGMFELLTSVTTIGPKNALSILSTLTVHQTAAAIMTNDITSLCKAPGVGKKTASRIILELVDRVGKLSLSETIPVSTHEGKSDGDEIETAIEALVSLGYQRQDVLRVIHSIEDELPIEKLIKQCIIRLSK